MTPYKIHRILIENFKPVTKALINFSETDLVVLDGPNGFGKTTIFDAIELVISGKISRVINTSDGREGFEDILFSKHKDRNTILKIEFTNTNEKFTVVKVLDFTKYTDKSDRKPDNWKVFDTYILDDFDDPIIRDKSVTHLEVCKRLKIENLDRYYNLFYYIQQEENTAFLKKPVKERMKEISHLFDTQKEQNEKTKLDRLKKLLEKESTKVNNELSEKNNIVQSLSVDLSNLNPNELIPADYFVLIQNKTPLKEWDQEINNITKETRDLFLAELHKLSDFISNYKEFTKSQENKILHNYATNNKLLKNVITGAVFLDKYDHIKKLKEKELKLRAIRDSFDKVKASQHPEKMMIENLSEWVGVPVNTLEIQGKIALLLQYKKSSSELSQIIHDLNVTREDLKNHFIKLKTATDIEHESCPFCGQKWETYEDLLKNVQEKTEIFSKLYDQSTVNFKKEIEELYTEHLENILNWINQYLSNPEFLIDKHFIKQLEESYEDRVRVEMFIKWCHTKEFDFSPYINKEATFVEDLDSKINALAKYLRSKRFEIKEGYAEFDDKTKEFEFLFKDIFQEEQERVQQLTPEMVTRKIQYIEYSYFRKNSDLKNKFLGDIDILNARSSNITNKIEQLKTITKVYEKKIQQHWQHIMKDIEIPFYIYSGKILQDYQRGIGLFIKESKSGQGATSIKFVSDVSTAHDAVNYLSSGQLSALIISFTLALNKVYGNKSLDVLLIDDPVQTMDEINMASFVELLRNEFRNKQIILSTHEDDISRYMRYKFRKYGLDTLRFNVKDQLYNNETF